jgi:ubiquinone/menaquinone biosynthesis C-methylase UbiE
MIKNKTVHHRGNSTDQFFDKKIIINELDIKPGLIIIDAGCGNGYMSKLFSTLVSNTGKIYALDRDSEAIQKLKNETIQTNIFPIVADITKKTEIKEHSIDIVYLSTVFHIFSDVQKGSFSEEVKRILKPKGKLAVIEIEKKGTPFGPPQYMRVSPEEMAKIIKMKPLSLCNPAKYFYMQVFENVDCTYFSM